MANPDWQFGLPLRSFILHHLLQPLPNSHSADFDRFIYILGLEGEGGDGDIAGVDPCA